MSPREYFPEEEGEIADLKRQVGDLQSSVGDCLRLLRGSTPNSELGLIKEFKEFKKISETRHEETEKTNKKIYNLLIGIAIGIAIGAVLFGYMTVKEFISVVK